MQIKQRIYLALCFITSIHAYTQPYISIVLDPSCNTRTIATEYENNVALLYAESMRNYFFTNHNSHVIEVTRGREKLEQYQAATFSNKIHPDLHISLHFTSTKHTPHIYIYYFTDGSDLPVESEKTEVLELTPVAYAHHTNQAASKAYAQTCYEFLKKKYSDNVTFTPPIGCPFKSLKGVVAPAIALEIDIENLESSELFQEILLDVMEQAPEKLQLSSKKTTQQNKLYQGD